jgi:hypothetical protein
MKMLEQTFLIALLIIVFWLFGFVAYLVVSNRQRDLKSELNEISDLLGDDSV